LAGAGVLLVGFSAFGYFFADGRSELAFVGLVLAMAGAITGSGLLHRS
jgi:hypothetical protein